ncbi:hypothetical protein OF83DRAFT_1057933 [Amylostereum chailletii]|nr:hypothetical protein OF83DRAFT_1057933 [Amylostereum chailletii]
MLSRKGVALVTGAARGIGRNISLRLAQDGFDVAVNDLPGNEEAFSVSKEIQSLGRRSCVVLGDISIEKDVEEMVSGVVTELGSLDVVSLSVYYFGDGCL